MRERAWANADLGRVAVFCIVLFAVAISAAAQAPLSGPPAPSPDATKPAARANEQVPIVRATTRLVSLEIVARDRQGRPSPG